MPGVCPEQSEGIQSTCWAFDLLGDESGLRGGRSAGVDRSVGESWDLELFLQPVDTVPTGGRLATNRAKCGAGPVGRGGSGLIILAWGNKPAGESRRRR